jgi:hypothetical protein
VVEVIDLFTRFWIKPHGAGGFLLLADGYPIAQGSTETIKRNRFYSRARKLNDD